jgi:hypothetical protein
MGKPASIHPGRWVVIGLLCLVLLGCGAINPRPPRAVVEGAIAQKLAQTQATLSQQLNIPFDSTKAAQVSGLRISSYHQTTLAGQPVVAVKGTYRLKGPTLPNAQKRQLRSFDISLKKGADPGEWRLVNDLTSASPP